MSPFSCVVPVFVLSPFSCRVLIDSIYRSHAVVKTRNPKILLIRLTFADGEDEPDPFVSQLIPTYVLYGLAAILAAVIVEGDTARVMGRDSGPMRKVSHI